jgi:hypothetical protein
VSEEKEFRKTLQAMSDDEFKRAYLDTKEVGWASMTRGQLHHWMAEVNVRGLGEELEDANGEIRLAPARHLVARVDSDLAASETMTGLPLRVESTVSGGLSVEQVRALAVEPDNRTDPPSTEENSGAPNGAESGYEIAAYRRLPLSGRRDAFVADGFLYVRESLLQRWFSRLTLGRCCPAQRERQAHHSSGCWLDAVR